MSVLQAQGHLVLSRGSGRTGRLEAALDKAGGNETAGPRGEAPRLPPTAGLALSASRLRWLAASLPWEGWPLAPPDQASSQSCVPSEALKSGRGPLQGALDSGLVLVLQCPGATGCGH